MPKTTRTFIALPLPPSLDQKLTRLQSLLAPDIPGARWTTTFPFHMTLAFLGDVYDADLNAVCKAVEEAARVFPPIELLVQGIGAFPNPARPRVIWAGLTADQPSLLAELQQAIVLAVTRAGYRPDDSRFTPHATLGRIKYDRKNDRKIPREADLTGVLEQFQSWSGGQFTAREIVTFSSSLTPDGPTYTPLAKARLSGKKTGLSP
jgi:2'-5' RNA ligase